ncbi:sensor histidine kinase [Paenibacillus sp. 481]|uniref:sensor histidine kinase n=1 Tax=Paenibacillus sp. 481 TaxID=2835869 RepID=UPI001E2BC019|nr:ATP-binding protein [Paenibacillus sp. 481]UHA74400.1 GHKL domain-containing protein [Paenibacillus sp. 481]
MKNSAFLIIRAIPLWKMSIYVLLSICLSVVTMYMLNLVYWGLDVTSITFHTMRQEFAQAYGPRHVDRLFNMLYDVFLVVFFGVFIVLFYFYEKKQALKSYFHHILNETRFIGNMNFEHEIKVMPNCELGDLAKEINYIVKQLKASLEEERRIEQTKKDLITNVSHDLRTPLTSIVGYLGLIQQDHYRDEVELRYNIEIVYDKVLRLNHLMNDLFEYTRFQNKGTPLHQTPINMTEMLDQLVVQFRVDIQQVNMEFRQVISSKKLMVLADGDKLVRVFENLIVNAMKYGSAGRFLDIAAREEQGIVVIDITNYGRSIPATDLPYIFERFYRVDKARSTHSGGSGLGLAIAKSIVELHQGTIEVCSDLEKTKFTVKLKSFHIEDDSPASS